MKPKTLVLLALAEALVLLLGVYFEPTFGVRGHLHGEAFFDGKSTSWWRQELERWEVRSFTVDVGIRPSDQHRVQIHRFQRNASWYEEWQASWFPAKPDPKPDANLVAAVLIYVRVTQHGPRLVHGDPEAIPVLQELLEDPSPEIRRIARIGLKMDPEGP